MPTLQVRELPEDVYRRLQKLAEAANHSLAQETVALLRKALELETAHQLRCKAILEALRQAPNLELRSVPSPQQMIREDRVR